VKEAPGVDKRLTSFTKLSVKMRATNTGNLFVFEDLFIDD